MTALLNFTLLMLSIWLVGSGMLTLTLWVSLKRENLKGHYFSAMLYAFGWPYWIFIVNRRK